MQAHTCLGMSKFTETVCCLCMLTFWEAIGPVVVQHNLFHIAHRHFLWVPSSVWSFRDELVATAWQCAVQNPAFNVYLQSREQNQKCSMDGFCGHWLHLLGGKGQGGAEHEYVHTSVFGGQGFASLTLNCRTSLHSSIKRAVTKQAASSLCKVWGRQTAH